MGYKGVYIARTCFLDAEGQLSEHFDAINEKVSDDHNNAEFQDIQSAVNEMLERIVTRVNGRGIFQISKIVPAGSMAEKTSIWKMEKPWEIPYTEFDFLAMLQGNINTSVDDKTCCVFVETPPVNMERLKEYYRTLPDKILSVNGRGNFERLFILELQTCLVSKCSCISVEYINPNQITLVSKCPKQAFGCEQCSVVMPTGVLRVNIGKVIDRYRRSTTPPEHCSLVFLWESKSRSIRAPESMFLQECSTITSLPVYVGFIPAIELSENSCTNNIKLLAVDTKLVVPKRCCLCRDKTPVIWRKSSCLSEVIYVSTVMEDRHRKCYKIIKYIIHSFFDTECNFVNDYHLKIVALNHDKSCCIDEGRMCSYDVK